MAAEVLGIPPLTPGRRGLLGAESTPLWRVNKRSPHFSKCPGGASALSQVVVFVCMHNRAIDADTIIAALPTLDAEELDRVRAAVEAMRRHSETSTVLERRSYRHGLLQLEIRTYTRKDGTEARRGPYWYFHYRDGGKQKTLYLGKTDEPKAVVDNKLF